MDLTPVKSIPNLVPSVASPTYTEQKTMISRTSNHALQLQEPVATPTDGPRPPMNLIIGAQQQYSHTGDTPLIGLATPSDVDGTVHPFAEQCTSNSVEVTENIYAQPGLPVGARPSASDSYAGSNVSGCNTVFSRTSGRSLVVEDNGNALNGSVMVPPCSGNSSHELYSSQRIKHDASRVSLSNNHDNAINV